MLAEKHDGILALARQLTINLADIEAKPGMLAKLALPSPPVATMPNLIWGKRTADEKLIGIKIRTANTKYTSWHIKTRMTPNEKS